MQNITIERKTKETEISLTLEQGRAPEVSTGIGFFDHMLTALSVHSGIGIILSCKGDLNVDGHHTVEDIGIVLGQAFAKAVDKSKIVRYGFSKIPMDESIAECTLDFSGRPFLVFKAQFANEMVGEFDTCLTEEFFRAVAVNSGMTLHLVSDYGSNDHHKIEALFKAFAHALKIAAANNETGEVLSSKGVL